MTAIPRPEHPIPQMERANWQNLNGEWNFAIDHGKSGVDRKWYEKTEFDQKIIVPFCPESELSGIEYKDFMAAVWYQRFIDITKEQLEGCVRLHFGAVDYECHVYINGKEAGVHKGGYSSFVFDITEYLTEGKNNLVVYAIDDTRSPLQPSGKHSGLYDSYGIVYTRSTGIWQTVWLEFVPKAYIKTVRYFPDIDNQTLTIEAKFVGGTGTFTAKAFYEGRVCGSACVNVISADSACVTIALSELHLWEVGAGRLYDLELTFGEDKVKSYFGMRTIRIEGYKYLINNRSVFQRLVLDQGYYPDGVYTAPTDADLINDIKISQTVGFNGARPHQKIFESRFLYHCDRLGYIVWGERADWGCDVTNDATLKYALPEWMETLERDFNHPAIIGWCPFNECRPDPHSTKAADQFKIFYSLTKQYDPTRPCEDNSGGYHVVTDVWDTHDYTHDAKIFATYFEDFAKGGPMINSFLPDDPWMPNIPAFVSEYGGVTWNPETDTWGFNDGPQNVKDFYDFYREVTWCMMDNPNIFGFCYTQLYDLEQENNGLYTYDRKPKFDVKFFHDVNTRKAAIEE